MNQNVQELFDSAVKLPLNMQSLLAEKLIDHVESHIEPSLEKLHIQHAQRRLQEIQNGEATAVEGTSALRRVRSRIAAR